MARKSYSKEFKARVALDAFKGQKTVGEIVVPEEWGCPEFCVNGQTDGVFRLTQRREYDHIKIQSRTNRWAAI